MHFSVGTRVVHFSVLRMRVYKNVWCIRVCTFFFHTLYVLHAAFVHVKLTNFLAKYFSDLGTYKVCTLPFHILHIYRW